MGYRLDISSRGIELISTCFGVRYHTRRYLLDANVDLYESWEADGPEGLEIRPLWGWGEESSECLGWPWREHVLRAEHARLNQQLAEERARTVRGPQPLHFALTPVLDDETLFDQRAYGITNARLRRARLTRGLRIEGIVLPAGSEVELNCDEWMDPRRPDRLAGATLSAPTELPLRGRPLAGAGTSLFFDATARPCSATGAFSGVVHIEGVSVDGTAPLGWDRTGSLDYFTLGASVRVESVELPAGSSVRVWHADLARRERFVTPIASVETPHGLASALAVDHAFTRVVGAMIGNRWRS